MQPSDLEAPELSERMFHDNPFANRHFLVIAYIPAPRYGPINTECVVRSNLSQIEMVEIASDWIFKGNLKRPRLPLIWSEYTYTLRFLSRHPINTRYGATF